MKEKSKSSVLKDLRSEIENVRNFISTSDENIDREKVYELYKNVYSKFKQLNEQDFHSKLDYEMFKKYVDSTGQHKFEIYLLAKGSKIATHDKYFQIEESLRKLSNYVLSFIESNT